MKTELDNRKILVKLIEHMNDSETLLMLAYADGYEAGKAWKHSCSSVDRPNINNN